MAGVPLAEAARFGCLTAARAVTIRESVPGFGTFAEIQEFAGAHGFDISPRLVGAKRISG
jgi:sugar/nucleoside kinase (ribokinase family)